MNSLPKTVNRQRHGCNLNPGPTAPKFSMLTTRLPRHPEAVVVWSYHPFYYSRVVVWPHPFQGWSIISRLETAMINICTKLEVSIHPCYEEMKCGAKWPWCLDGWSLADSVPVSSVDTPQYWWLSRPRPGAKPCRGRCARGRRRRGAVPRRSSCSLRCHASTTAFGCISQLAQKATITKNHSESRSLIQNNATCKYHQWVTLFFAKNKRLRLSLRFDFCWPPCAL